MQYLAIGLRCWIAVVFLISFVSKVAGRGAFAGFTASVRDLRVLPQRVAGPAALAVTGAELGACALLAYPVPTAALAGFGLAAGLLTAFGGVIALSVRRGVRVPCRCFGASGTPLGQRHLVRNIVLAAAALAGAAALPAAGPVRPAGALLAVSGGALLGVLVAALDDILDLFQPVTQAPGKRPGAAASRQETHHGGSGHSTHLGRSGLRPGPGPHPGRDQAVARPH